MPNDKYRKAQRTERRGYQQPRKSAEGQMHESLGVLRPRRPAPRAPPRTRPSVSALRRLTPSPRRRSCPTPGGCNAGRVGEDATGVSAAGLRLRSAGGLAGEPAAEALPGLEEAEAAGQAGDDSEEAGPGVSPSAAAPARPPRSAARGLGCRRPEPGSSHSASRARLLLECR